MYEIMTQLLFSKRCVDVFINAGVILEGERGNKFLMEY